MIEIAVALIVLHSVDGYDVSVNPKTVTTLRATRPGEPNRLVTDKAHCIVGTTDGKFFTVAEPCDEIRKLMDRRD